MRFYDPKLYTTIYANEYHLPITKLSQIRRYDYSDLVIFKDGIPVGKGCLNQISKKRRWLSTDSVSLGVKYRRKGHGIALYYHLIETARLLGAERIYSSDTRSLNKFSRRMWKTKLKLFGYKVKEKTKRHKCEYCDQHEHTCIDRYYIDLNKA